MTELDEVIELLKQVTLSIPSHLRDIAIFITDKFGAGNELSKSEVEEMSHEELCFTLGVALGVALASKKMAEMMEEG